MVFNKRKYPEMNRLYLLLLMTTLWMGCAKAQSFSEWFKQKKTQKKYLLAQIAALQTYLQAVEKGYHIADEGLSAVSALKGGDFLQHALHFQGLEMVSPSVKGYAKVIATAEMEDRSERLRVALLAEKDLDRLLNSSELTALHKIYSSADAEAIKDLEQLELLVTDGKLKMTDDERITRVDELYLEVKKKLQAVAMLAANVRSLMDARKKRKDDTRVLKGIYGKNN